MKKYWSIGIVAGICLLVVAGVTGYYRVHLNREANTAYRTTTVTLGGVSLHSRIADTDALRTQGLSGTAPLAPDQAMLFVFDTAGPYSFWMKDMNYPIDMIWLDSTKHVVYIKEHALPESYPEIYGPQVPALYVIEVPDGFSSAHNLKVGDQAQFSL